MLELVVGRVDVEDVVVRGASMSVDRHGRRHPAPSLPILEPNGMSSCCAAPIRASEPGKWPIG